MCAWLGLTPDQASRPSAGAEGGRGGACAHVCCSEAHTQVKQSGRVRRPPGLAGGAQTHLGMPVGGIFACCVLPGGVPAPAASSHGREPGLGGHMPQRLCIKTGDTPVVRDDSGSGPSFTQRIWSLMWLDGPTPLPACLLSSHTATTLINSGLGV